MLLKDLLGQTASVIPEKCAVYSQESAYSYRELVDLSKEIAFYLATTYKLENKKVIIHSCNSSHYILLIFALLECNCTIIPVSVTCNQIELEYIIEDSNPVAIFTDNYCMEKYSEIYNDNLGIYCIISDIINYVQDNDCSESNKPIFFSEEVNDIAFIIYSSGTSGDLKGIMCSQDAILFAIKAINDVIKNKEDDIVLMALPLSFDYGLYQIFLVIYAHATAYIHNSLINALEIPNIIMKNNITGFPALPMWLNILSETNRISSIKLASLRYITSTGDVLKVNIIEELMSKLKNISVYPMYGLTECKRVCILNPSDFAEHKESVGLPLKGTSVRIVDSDGASVGTDQPGELVVRGPHLMPGYFKDEQLTKDRYRFNIELGETELYTGDIFKMDKDGFLYFVSRTQFFIKRRGQRISPRMIESFINGLSGVIDNVVVPVRRLHEECVACFVRLESDDLFNDVRETILKETPLLYKPDYIILHNGYFPYNTNGKINRKLLIQKAEEEFYKIK